MKAVPSPAVASTAPGRPRDPEQALLRRRDRPPYEQGADPVRLVDLFCGCGGMSLGAAEAARRHGRALHVALAADLDADATAVYARNFPKATVKTADVEAMVDGEVGDAPTEAERALIDELGTVDWLIGGPPCQGHSDLNNHTRRDDPRNSLYLKMARAAALLRPATILIENVPGALRDKGRAVQETEQALSDIGYSVAHRVVRLVDIGVPQRRRRHVLLACRGQQADSGALLDRVQGDGRTDVERTVRWAIGDLAGIDSSEPFDRSSRISPANRDRIDWLFDHDAHDLPNDHRPPCHQNDEHTYRSMYGRLRWDQPAQTITTGFTSMGQGRFVHPSERRTLTPHEAARLQFLPDFLDFSPVTRRGAWARMIGNAVPLLLSLRILDEVLQLAAPAAEPSTGG